MTWSDWALEHEQLIRLSFFLGVFAAVAIAEIVSPRRKLTAPKAIRWANNLGLVLLNTLVLRLLFPAAAVGVAAFAQTNGWGIINHYQPPYIIAVFISVIVMDMIIYLQHVLVHAVPALWRLHMVHHVDPDYDVTTGARFHTLEIIISMLIKFATIVVLGPPVVGVVIFEVLLNATAMFNHGNIRLPESIDRILRLFVVTPDMHRVHHSVIPEETNSNFGFNLPWWDRIFGTYRAQPQEGHEGMTIGIHNFNQPRQISQLPGMLALPFVAKASGYAINERKWNKPKAGE
jgi:sterol desaturase/sphingolipid hydroxylase (fatty acid hydroxylase superfamily)